MPFLVTFRFNDFEEKKKRISGDCSATVYLLNCVISIQKKSLFGENQFLDPQTLFTVQNLPKNNEKVARGFDHRHLIYIFHFYTKY